MKYLVFYTLRHEMTNATNFGRLQINSTTPIEDIEDVNQMEFSIAKKRGWNVELVVITNIIKLPL